jgi:hemerythrin-like domain-containing protein
MGNGAVFEKASDDLRRDHRVIEKVLTVLERLTERPIEGSIEAWRRALDFIRNFADKCHHLKEEKIFFPALEERGIPREGGPIGIMLMEHEEGRGYVKLMAAALALTEEDPQADETSLIDNARAYLRLLRQHIRKEEEILFELADEILTREEQNRLLREFEEHEAREIGAGVHERYLKIAEELEETEIRAVDEPAYDKSHRLP